LSVPGNYVALNASGTSSYNIDITNGVDTLIMRIDSETDIDDSLNIGSTINQGDTICGLLGIGGQYDAGTPFTEEYQIFPMRYSDLTICKLIISVSEINAERNEFLIVPNPAKSQFSIQYTAFNHEVTLFIYNVQGKLVHH
tara:strand:+ start:399 stop:821 length:423 start_codon:yes stop_codon:yes gene_type:complete